MVADDDNTTGANVAIAVWHLSLELSMISPSSHRSKEASSAQVNILIERQTIFSCLQDP